ncbi:hypothetical protein FGO68_gene8428 [Halteria grandinella]|uniref:Uncharacterized protein n=1 Tax=Halteria grandinella TaxID=5974 RepID=A0A8J8NZJ8_HALGN|nr:hypothetical protein FGO68_gene8428 [Halteria grandinella]
MMKYINMATLQAYLEEIVQPIPPRLFQDIRAKLHTLTIDQIKNEEASVQEAIDNQKRIFSESQLTLKEKKERYASLCEAHKLLYGGNDQGLLSKLEAEHKSVRESYSLFFKQLFDTNTEIIEKKTEALNNSQKNYDKIVDFINYPNIINQLLQQNQLVQATKLIRHYQNNIKPQLFLQGETLVSLVDKEITILRAKLIKAVYLSLERSFLPTSLRKTKECFTLLKALGETKGQIESRLFDSRAKHLRDFMQKSMLKLKEKPISEVLKEYLSLFTQNLNEFQELKVEYDEWMIDRVSEIREIIRIICKRAEKIEEVWTIDGHITKAKIDGLEVGDIIEEAAERLKMQQVLKIVDTSDIQLIAGRAQLILQVLNDNHQVRMSWKRRQQDEIIREVYEHLAKKLIKDRLDGTNEEHLGQTLQVQIRQLRESLMGQVSQPDILKQFDIPDYLQL